ncbi:MAG: hypothetical protein IKC87_06325 [Clostridia bacterium]|nr:hypothetical protein [Clostridia bacterium]
MDICDFHSHILPALDHGTESIDESLKQLALARKFGVSRIFATSHFYPHKDSVEQFIAKREISYRSLMNEHDGLPEVRLGAEVLLCPGLDSMPGLESLCLSGTRHLLLELPFNDFSTEYVKTAKAIVSRGYNVILAHAERYDPDHVDLMLDVGAVIQLNAPAVATLFRKRSVNKWLAAGVVVAIGSDIHHADPRAYKDFRTAVKRLGKYADFVKKSSDEIWEQSK